MGYLLNYAMIDHFLSGNRSCQIVAAVIFLLLFVTFSSCYQNMTSFCCVYCTREKQKQPSAYKLC